MDGTTPSAGEPITCTVNNGRVVVRRKRMCLNMADGEGPREQSCGGSQ